MQKKVPIFIGLIFLLIAVWLQVTPIRSIRLVITRLDRIAYDMELRTKIFTGQLKKRDENVVIVDIDDKSLKDQGRWPWPRLKLAELIARLQQEGAVVIALDMIFPESEENIADVVLQELNKEKLDKPSIQSIIDRIEPFFNYDKKLAEKLAQSDTVLGMSFLPTEQLSGIVPKPLLTLNTPAEKQLGLVDMPGLLSNIDVLQQAAKNAGFINYFSDTDGILRRVPLLIRYHDDVYPSLALAAVRLYLLADVSLITAWYEDQMRLEGVKLGDRVILTSANSEVMIPFRGGSYTLPYFSASDVLHERTPKNSFSGKIVFIGTSATGLGDLQPTAIQSAFPGVEVQATLAEGILANSFPYRPDWAVGAEIVITIGLGLLFALTFPFLGPAVLSILLIGIPFLLMFANNEFAEKTRIILSILIPMVLIIILALINILYGYFFESRRREQLKMMFGQYVPEKHIDEMLQTKSSYALYGEDREMTVLFADIRNFTSISEGLTAAQLKEILNEFFTPMTEIIFKHHGTIDKYVGDLIMAFWGAPLRDKHHAENALSAAIEMQDAVAKLKKIFAEHQWPEINIGIGLNSGVMSVGDMGSKFRRNYTVLGDAVNLASRIEGLTRFYGVNTLVTEQTQKEQPHFVFKQIDRVRVKGKKEGINIFELICKKINLTETLAEEIQLMQNALNFYFNQEWKSAREIFQQLQKMYPDKKLYNIYLARITEFEKTPPFADWNGVYEHLSK